MVQQPVQTGGCAVGTGAGGTETDRALSLFTTALEVLAGGTTACTCTSRWYNSLLVVLAGGRETDRAPPNT